MLESSNLRSPPAKPGVYSREITCSEQERKFLNRLAGSSRTELRRSVERARIILHCLAGKQVQDIVKECHTPASTVIKWRNRFAAARIAGLSDAPRPGAGKNTVLISVTKY